MKALFLIFTILVATACGPMKIDATANITASATGTATGTSTTVSPIATQKVEPLTVTVQWEYGLPDTIDPLWVYQTLCSPTIKVDPSKEGKLIEDLSPFCTHTKTDSSMLFKCFNIVLQGGADQCQHYDSAPWFHGCAVVVPYADISGCKFTPSYME